LDTPITAMKMSLNEKMLAVAI
jgi:hypothetical protein